jgi:hypothetical protein
MIPLSGRVTGRASGPSRSRVDDGGGLQYVLWKSVRLCRVFPSRGIYRRKGDVRRWTRWSPPPGGVARGWPMPPNGADTPWSISVSPLDSVFVSVK